MAAKGDKSLYLPALLIVATVFLLLLVIALSTYRNMDRERQRMEESLLRDGRVILYSLAAALQAEPPREIPDSRRLNRFLADIGRDTDIRTLSIIDGEGRIVASLLSQDGEQPIRGGASLNLLLREKGIVTRYGYDRTGERVFEIIQPLRPLFSSTPLLPGRQKAEGEGAQTESLNRWSQDKIMMLSFHQQVFETARKADIHHIILMGAILIILGAGTFYFIFIVQKYYLVDRTLGQMKSYLENVVDSMADGLISLDNQWRIVTMNRQAAAMFGVQLETAQGQPFGEVLGEGNEPFLEAARVAVIRDQELDLGSRRGETVPVALSAAPLKDERGEDMGLVILIRDRREIRELKENIRRSERLASLGRLAAGVAHEIRNPLSSIRGFAQFFLNRFRGQPEEEEYAGIMVKEVDRLNRVITELLDFARPRELHREPASLPKIIDYDLQLLAMELAAKKVVVEKKYADDLPPVQVDQEQISQALLNLLLNALDAVEEGGKIFIGLYAEPRRRGIDIMVADNGRGIPPEDREKVFEPFYSTKRKGTGLGLAIVNQIVEGHGGEVKVEGRAEGGTVVIVSLPAGG